MFGALLRELRGNLTQEEFAAKIGISRPYLSQLESGERQPPDSEGVAWFVRLCGLEPREQEIQRTAQWSRMLWDMPADALFMRPVLEALGRAYVAGDGQNRQQCARLYQSVVAVFPKADKEAA